MSWLNQQLFASPQGSSRLILDWPVIATVSKDRI